MKKIYNFLMKDNPIFVMLLGMCSTLAITTTFEKSYLMGLAVLIVMVITSIVISLISKYVSDEIRIITFIIIIATIVTLLEVILKKYIPSLYVALGVYLPLITVNCLLLGQALSHFSKNNVKKSIIEALKISIQFLISIAFFGLLRELLGTGKITFMDSISNITKYRSIVTVFKYKYLYNNFFVTSAGAFITLGILIALIKKEEK